MIQKDFDFVVSLADTFFAQKYIQKRLKLIEREKITGWEIWFQVEFSLFLESQRAESIAEWDREYLYSIDRRRSKERDYMAIDFIFRKKRSAVGRYIALEIKQNRNVSSCIKGMMEDACKVALVRASHDDLRSMWTLGIHPAVEHEVLMKKVGNYAEEYDVALLSNCIVSKEIKKTNLVYTIF